VQKLMRFERKILRNICGLTKLLDGTWRINTNEELDNLIIITPWPESANILNRPSDRRLSAKLVPTFADTGVSRGQRGGFLRP
jgi:hypothetical protein